MRKTRIHTHTHTPTLDILTSSRGLEAVEDVDSLDVVGECGVG